MEGTGGTSGMNGGYFHDNYRLFDDWNIMRSWIDDLNIETKYPSGPNGQEK